MSDWLHETYFEDDKKAYFSKEDIEVAGALLQLIMQFRPSDRPRVFELLNHPWLQHKPFTT